LEGKADANARLVECARAGDAQAFGELVRRHLGAAHAVALAILQNPVDAEEAAQDAFIIALEKLDDCRDSARFSGWLLRIVRNRALNLREAGGVRRRGVSTLDAANESPSPERSPLDHALGQQAKSRLLGALEVLSEVQREVVLLHDLEGWTHSEIGSSLGLSEGMSRQHLFQARRLLRDVLGTARDERRSR